MRLLFEKSNFRMYAKYRIMKKYIIHLLMGFIVLQVNAGFTVYDYPSTLRQSEFYRVSIRQGAQTGNPFVHVSECPDGPFAEHKIWITEQDRSMSFTQFDFDGAPVEVTVTKQYGTPAHDVRITPSRYGIEIVRFDGRSVTFRLESPEYVSVRFVCDDNTDEFNNIKNGMMVFADRPQEFIPDTNAKGVTVYRPGCDLANAQTVYFVPGEYHLQNDIPNGSLLLHDDQSIYLAGGAYVYGMVNGTASYNARIFGRGIISGYQHEFHYDGQRQLIEMDPDNYRLNLDRGRNHTIEGVTFLESVNHTLVVPDYSLVKDVKFIAWACNNDGLRSGNGCVIDHVFMKLCDDYFYGTNDALITRCVLWPMFNGAVLQLGWGNRGSGNSGTRFINNDIINPEWDWIGSNTGFIASQLKPDAKIHNITVEDLHIDGDINALVALDFATIEGDTYNYTGRIGDITLRNVELNGRQIWWGSRGWDDYERLETQLSRDYNINPQYPALGGRSIIKGIEGPDGKRAIIDNIRFENVRINGEWITEKNYQKYFDIDTATTRNIEFAQNMNYTFREPSAYTSTLAYMKQGIGAQPVGSSAKDAKACGWLPTGEIQKFKFDVPASGSYEIRYSLMPVYTNASVTLTLNGQSQQIELLAPTDNALAVIKRVCSEKIEIDKGRATVELAVKKGVIYNDLIEIVADSLAPGTNDYNVYTHWHGIISRGESNWKSKNLHLIFEEDTLMIYNGYRKHSGAEALHTSLSASIVDPKGKVIMEPVSCHDYCRFDISALKPGAYYVMVSDERSYWIFKQLIMYSAR